MPTPPTIAILPFACPGWRQNENAVRFARGLAVYVESRLKTIPRSTALMQHLLYSPKEEIEARQLVVRSKMWSLEEALSLPLPRDFEPTHYVQGRVVMGQRIEVGFEVFDATAGYSSYRDFIVCDRSDFLRKFFAQLATVATVVEPNLKTKEMDRLASRPTESFAAFEAYLCGVAQRVAAEVTGESENGGGPFDPFLESLRHDPDFHEPAVAIDALAQESFRLQRQEKAALQALAAASNTGAPYRGFRRTLGIYWFEQGDFSRAREELEFYVTHLPQDDPLAPGAYVRLAAIYHQAETPDQAVALLRKAAGIYPNDPDIQESLGVCLARTGDMDTAEKCWWRVVEEHPRRVTSLSNLAMLLAARGEAERARVLFERSIETPETNSVAFGRYVDFLLETDDLERGDAVGTEWVERHADNWRAWVRLSHIRRRRGQMTAAAYCLEQAETLLDSKETEGEFQLARFALDHPSDYRIYLGACGVAVPQCKPGESERDFTARQTKTRLSVVKVLRHLTDKHPRQAFLWETLADRLAKLEQYESAIVAQEKVVELLPRFAEGHNMLGLLKLRAGRRDEAVVSLRQAVALAPVAGYVANLVSALIESGQLDEAESRLEEAIPADPRNEMFRALRIKLEYRRQDQDARQPRSGLMRWLLSLIRRP